VTTLWTRCAIAALAVVFCSAAKGQSSAVDAYDRCMSNSAAFAKDENLNEVVANFLAGIQKEIDSSVHVSRVARMAGLEEQSKQARSRADRHMLELQQACAHLSQSMAAASQQPKADQTAGLESRARFEQELNRRVPGAIFVMHEAEFSQWLDGKQGKTPRRNLWEQAVLSGDFEQAAQVLRDYERELKSK
jgi:hypothetical protein